MNLPNISTKRETLSNHAYQVIRDAIVTLRFEPGQPVFEAELGNTLGVSRTPIREAFRRLLAEELIEVQPQRGSRIAYISRKKIDEARFVRLSLEVSAFKELAKKWDKDDPFFQDLKDQIIGILEEHMKMAEEKNFDASFTLDEKFHYCILESMGNSTLISIIDQMRGHLNRIRYLELKETKHLRQVANEHEAIFHAIISNDVVKTEQLLSNHIRWLEADTYKLIEKFPHFFKE